jgi:hypothetical protein
MRIFSVFASDLNASSPLASAIPQNMSKPIFLHGYYYFNGGKSMILLITDCLIKSMERYWTRTLKTLTHSFMNYTRKDYKRPVTGNIM